MKPISISFLFFLIVVFSQSTFFGTSNLASNFFNLFTKYWGIDEQKIPEKTLIPNVNRNAPPSTQPKTIKASQNLNLNPNKKTSLIDPVNRIEDGKLSNVKIGQQDNQQWVYVNGKIGNWEVQKGQIGNGKFYNIGWNESSKVLELDSDENQIYKYVLSLNGGLYELNFDWAARQQQPLETSQFIVRFNGEDIAEIKADNFDINHFQKQVSTFKGNNDIKLIGSGSSDGYGITVGNFAIYKSYQDPTQPGFLVNKQDLPITYVPNDVLPFSKINNYLTNGDFQLSRIPNGERFYITSQIPSWVVSKGQLGVGEYYNINWAPRTQLIHLDIGRNLNYLNRVNLGKGKFELSFDWAAKDGKRYDTSQFLLRFNNKLMKTLKPWDYYCHRYSIIVDSSEGINTIELVGSGPMDSFGATIDNVVLRDYYGH